MSKGAVLLVTVLSSFLAPLMGSAVNVALPSIGNEFAADAVLLSWVQTTFLLASVVFLVPCGRIADIHGREKILFLGTVIYFSSAFLCSTAGSIGVLILFRAVQGMGVAMLAGTAVAILTSVFPPHQRGRVFGITVAATYSGLSLGPFLGGLMTQHLGWRAIFLANVPAGIIMILAVLWGLRGSWAEARGQRFDLAGSILYGIGLVMLMYGLSVLPSASGWAFVGGGTLGLAVFVIWEARESSPVLNVRLFSGNAVFALSNLAALIHYCVTFAQGFLLSLYLQQVKGFSPQDAGIVLVSQPIVMAALSPLAGRLSDRFQPRVLASVGMGLTLVGLLVFALLDAETSLELILAGLIVSGVGFAFFSSPNVNAIMSSVQKQHYGVASAIMATMRSTGQMLSMGITVVTFAVTMGRVQITPDHFPLFLISTRLVFLVFAAMCLVGLFASLARGKVR